jgi:hypothetical protein
MMTLAGINSVLFLSDHRRGFYLVIGFIEHLQIVTASTYSAIANSHIQQLNTARTKPSQSALSSPVVVW